MSRPGENDTVILTGVVGSHSYGTATAASDFDYMSVVIPSVDVYLGLRQWGNSNTMEEVYEDPLLGQVEHRYFELRKFLGLCEGFNPNVFPLLWLNPEHYTILTPEGQMLLDNRNLFNSKRAYDTFCGYAHSQLQKMGGVFNDDEEPNKRLKKGHLRFQEWADEAIDYQRYLRHDPKMDDAKRGVNTAYDEGYLNALIALRTHSKEETKRIKDGPITGRMGAKRKELRDRFGFDTKFLFHTIRLMKMCVEFITRPDEGLKVDRTGIDAEFLYSIREGCVTQEDGKKLADDLFVQAKVALANSTLPDEPDHEAISTLCKNILSHSLLDC